MRIYAGGGYGSRDPEEACHGNEAMGIYAGGGCGSRGPEEACHGNEAMGRYADGGNGSMCAGVREVGVQRSMSWE